MNSVFNTIFFDLDNTLFDHDHSLRNALNKQRIQFDLDSFTVDHLIDTYNTSLQVAYDRYLQKEISYEEKDLEKVRLFFQNLSLPVPGQDSIDIFLRSYDEVYFSNRRATPGTVETLVRLNEHGFKIGVVTNGQTQAQREKMEAIGIADLIDGAFTSEQIGYPKPSPHMFQAALDAFDASAKSAVMVGDDIKSDIEGALAHGINAVLYNPVSKEAKVEVAGSMIHIIHHMKELLGYLSLS